MSPVGPLPLLRALRCGLFAALTTASAFAQRPLPSPPSAATVGESLTGAAKEEYASARLLYDDHDYAGALVKFQRAFDVSGDVRLLWNMAACEKNLRHYAHVLHLVERYRREGDARMTNAQRAEAEDVVRTVRALVSTVHLVVNEPGASVQVDDEQAGATPLSTPLLVDLGARRIRVAKPGFKPQVITQELAGGSEVTFTVTLEPEARNGRVVIAAGSSDEISVDGVAEGRGRWEGQVTAGSHSVSVTASGMRQYVTEFVVREGETRTLGVALEADRSGISPVIWIGGGVLAVAGAGIGAYFLFRPASTAPSPTVGTLSPGTVQLPAFRWR